MKKLFTLLCVFFTSAFLVSAQVTNLGDIAQSIADGATSGASFNAGSGNLVPANTTPFVGIKLGAGLGLVIPATYSELSKAGGLDKISDPKLIGGAIPFFNPLLYFKIGFLPLPLPLLDKLDLGIRVGMFPNIALAAPSGFTLKYGSTHFGGEVRTVLFELPAGLLRIEARVSGDYDSGNLGIKYTIQTNGQTGSIDNTINWGGTSFAAKAVAGLNIPLIGGAYVGAGLNLNFGEVSVKSALDGVGTISVAGMNIAIPGTLSATRTSSYDPFELRILGGAQLLFLNVAAEYGILSKNLGAYVALSFTFL